MKEFNCIALNGEKFLGGGVYSEVGSKRAIVLESEILIELFTNYFNEKIVINRIELMNERNEVLRSYTGEYIVDSISNKEVTIFPIQCK